MIHLRHSPRKIALLLSSICLGLASLEIAAASPFPTIGKVLAAREVNANWYDVPAGSIPRRRAGPGELIAAHNHLRFGTRVRVTHITNGKTVIVRITDRGIPGHRITLDLCKEAAEQLGMVKEGTARVRMEVLPDDKESSLTPRTKPAQPHLFP